MIVDVNVLSDIAESSGIDRLEKWSIPVHRRIEKKGVQTRPRVRTHMELVGKGFISSNTAN